ncbi:STAS domain-containing protein [Pseudonocardia sp.]|uniref:STAS domain-containing protein n=1 Tax=Pseudonocardia sp. TaxID=60912 RepID=UPI00260B6B0B|nr:STAS domain-containing protein [Pseudonocardia sp.]
MPSPDEVGQASIHLAVSRLSAGAVVVHVQGEIDMLTAPLFTREVVQVLDPTDNLLALDMARVGFLGASGLSALVDILDAVERTGSRLCVVFPSRAVRRALDVVGMPGRFNVYPAPVQLAS